MKQSYFILIALILALSTAASQAGAAAVKPSAANDGNDFKVVYRDLLGGWGEFDYGAGFYDESIMPGEGWKNIFRLPAVDHDVGVGWRRFIQIQDPKRNYDPLDVLVSRITERSDGKGKCQYLAVHSIESTSPWTAASLKTAAINVDAKRSYAPHPGDEVSFRLDYLQASPDGLMPELKTCFEFWDGKNWTSTQYRPLSAGEPFKVQIPAGTIRMSVVLCMQLWGGTQGNEPGFYIDGAHLFIKRDGASKYETEAVPAPRNRSIVTMGMGTNDEDTYFVASNHDIIFITESLFQEIARLRYYNPDIKIYLYESGGTLCDMRTRKDSTDSWWSPCVFTYSDVMEHHKDWLYSSGLSAKDDPRHGRKGLEDWMLEPYALLDPAGYPRNYSYRKYLPDFQKAWSASAIAKVNRYHADGVFIDDLGPWAFGGDLTRIPGDPKGPKIYSLPWETQNFVHAAARQFHANGLSVIQNACAVNLKTGYRDGVPVQFNDRFPEAGRIYLDPNWLPSDWKDKPTGRQYRSSALEYSTANHYSANNRGNTPDALYQEWAFFVHWGGQNEPYQNRYRLGYWLDCLQDMDRVAEMNADLPPGATPKMLHMQTRGVDRPEDPADYPNKTCNGWAHFGLCSYLLGQNKYTTFGASSVGVPEMPSPNYSCTIALGEAKGPRKSLTPDDGVQIRYYANGFVIANGRPSGAANLYTFKPDRDVYEEITGKHYTAGEAFVLEPHRGRVFYFESGRR